MLRAGLLKIQTRRASIVSNNFARSVRQRLLVSQQQVLQRSKLDKPRISIGGVR